VLQIGTDPAEWWDSFASFHHALQAQAEELAGVQVNPGDLRAYPEGTVGWAADRPTFRLPNGLELPRARDHGLSPGGRRLEDRPEPPVGGRA
jgi:hypothetical protein